MVSASGLRVVFFGTPRFAVPTLDALLASQHAVVGIVTQPDRPRGRGQKPTDAPVKARALAAGLPILQPATLKDAATLDAIARLGADIGVVAAYGRILTEAILAIPPRGMINVHASLLPKYRGAAPVHRAVMAGEDVTGVTIMRVVKALDAGAIFAATPRAIGPDDTSEEVERDLAALGAQLLVETLDRLARGPVDEIPQDDAQATYAHRLAKADGVMVWSRPARDLHNQVRGLHPWPHAFTYLDGERLILLRSTWSHGVTDERPGTVVRAEGDDLQVATGGGTLIVTELQAEGRRATRTRAFLAGHPLAKGLRFSQQS
jgi:methionyl-tRNA formyltransferase